MKLFFLCLTAVAANLSLGCQPCLKMLSAQETWDKADLVLEVDSDGSALNVSDTRPEKAQLVVRRVIKGSYLSNRITVGAWSGMCQYGVVLDKGRYVVFLSHVQGIYTAVDLGCNQTPLRVTGEKVQINEDWIPVKALKKRLSK